MKNLKEELNRSIEELLKECHHETIVDINNKIDMLIADIAEIAGYLGARSNCREHLRNEAKKRPEC